MKSLGIYAIGLGCLALVACAGNEGPVLPLSPNAGFWGIINQAN